MLPLEALEVCELFGLALLELPFVRAADELDRAELARDRLVVLFEFEPDRALALLDVPFFDVEREPDVELSARLACVRPRLFPRRDCPDWLETAISTSITIG